MVVLPPSLSDGFFFVHVIHPIQCQQLCFVVNLADELTIVREHERLLFFISLTLSIDIPFLYVHTTPLSNWSGVEAVSFFPLAASMSSTLC